MGGWGAISHPSVFIQMTTIKKEKYSQYVQSEDWSNLKKNFYSKNEKVCNICRTKKLIQLHHLTYKLFNPNLVQQQEDFLIPLCKNCHFKTHSREYNLKGIGDPLRNPIYLRRHEFLSCLTFKDNEIVWNIHRYKQYRKRFKIDKPMFSKKLIKRKIQANIETKRRLGSTEKKITKYFDKLLSESFTKS